MKEAKTMSEKLELGLIKAYVLPHPPIIIPEVGRGDEKKIQKTLDAMTSVAKEIADLKPDTIIISSPHAPAYRDGFFFAAGPKVKGSLAAFGLPQVRDEVKIDQELLDRVLETMDREDMPYIESREGQYQLDHAAMVPLYFIHRFYRDFKVLILALSGLSNRLHYELGRILSREAKKAGRRMVYIASGDLSHVLKEDGPYGYRPEGPAFDRKIMHILEEADFDALLAITPREMDQAAQCGARSFQIMAGALDGLKPKAKRYSYEGPFGVGYGVLSYTPQISAYGSRALEEEDPYVALARQTIENYVRKEDIGPLPKDLPEEMLANKAGVFVSIHEDGELRGCIGTIRSYADSIAEEIRANAISAASRDPRFYPVREEELDRLEISVDILGPAEPIDAIDQLDPQAYGVIVKKGGRLGLLLPRLEGVEDSRTQVRIALRKAGIDESEDYAMERFEVVRHE